MSDKKVLEFKKNDIWYSKLNDIMFILNSCSDDYVYDIVLRKSENESENPAFNNVKIAKNAIGSYTITPRNSSFTTDFQIESVIKVKRKKAPRRL
jgi:hypothetical protein